MPPYPRRNFMNVINIQHLKITIGARNLLNLKNLQVQEGQRIGIVGKNGSGKTTLFKALLGEIETDVSNFLTNGRLSMLSKFTQTDTFKRGGEVFQAHLIII